MRYLLKRHKIDKDASLQHKFFTNVLAPPFALLVLLGVIGLWQLNALVQQQSVNNLQRAANTTAAKLEREFSIRQTVLERTGEELFVIKNEFATSRNQLDQDRDDCSGHTKQSTDYLSAPNNACEPFLEQFARSGGSSLQAVEDGYVAFGEQLTQQQNKDVNQRLAAFKLFFPETLALVVVDDQKNIVSSALAGSFDDSAHSVAEKFYIQKGSFIEGLMYQTEAYEVALFAYAIDGGHVIALYDVNSDTFMESSWSSTPIDNSNSLAVIISKQGNAVYPKTNINDAYTPINNKLRSEQHVEHHIKGISHISVADEVGGSGWAVVVSSPSAIVLGPVRDAQITAVIIMGLLLVGFLWLGTFYIRRMVQSIMRLVSGAIVFAAGTLDYKIQLENSAEEFEKLANTMNGMAQRIAKAEKEIDEKNKEFISIATHELRTPLTAIKGNLSMAFEDMNAILPDQVKPIVAEAYKGTTRLATLVNDMLDMARLDGGRVDFDIKPQNITSLTKDIINSLIVTAKEKPVTLVYENQAPFMVMADAVKLRIVVTNFLSNAIKYNRPNGSVCVTHEIKNNMVITSFADTGLGIPEDQKKHMFEKFFRVKHSDRQSVIGTGLGMYVTKEYIIKMGGKVWFESVHGEGTTFFVSLPISAQESTNVMRAPAANSNS